MPLKQSECVVVATVVQCHVVMRHADSETRLCRLVERMENDINHYVN